MKSQSVSKNHERAPECAAFVKAMREVFGDAKVTWVKEGDFEMGAKDESEWVVATAGYISAGVSVSRSAQAKGANARGDAQT